MTKVVLSDEQVQFLKTLLTEEEIRNTDSMERLTKEDDEDKEQQVAECETSTRVVKSLMTLLG